MTINNTNVQKNKKAERIKLIVFFATLLIISVFGIIVKDKWISIVTGITLIGYILPLIYSHKLGLFMGLCYSAIYLYYAFTEKLWATCIYELCFALPCLFLSLIHWQQDVEKVYYKASHLILILFWSIFVLLVALLTFVLKIANDTQPFLDAIEFTINTEGLFLLIYKFRLYWWTNFISLFAGTILWVIKFHDGAGGLTLALTEFILLVLGTIALFKFYCSKNNSTKEYSKSIFENKKKKIKKQNSNKLK